MRKLFFGLLFLSTAQKGFTQQLNDYIKGHFSGSYENYSQYYMKDSKINAFLPLDRFASNSFLKLDYQYGDFSAGVQAESYLPAIAGFFPSPVDAKTKIVNKYFRYNGKKFSVQVGDFYEQFGNGLVLRSFENRQIGINNALEGFKAEIQATDYFKIKTVYGRTRLNLDYINAFTRGIDAEIDLHQLMNISSKSKLTSLSLGGSAVSRYQEYVGPEDGFPTTANAYAGRVDLSLGGLTLNTEYATKSADPHLMNSYSRNKGAALQVNAGFSTRNFGTNVTFRSISNMEFKADRDNEFTTQGPVNFLPSITKQHDNLTSNIYVYAAQARGESGFQSDIFYTFPAGSSWGGKYGTTLSLNISHYQSLNEKNEIMSFGESDFFSDASLEIRKKWSKKWEGHFEVQQLKYNGALQGASYKELHATVFALSSLYKFNKHRSIRCKLEHMTADQDKGNWAAGLLEFSLSSPFAIFMSDLYNYDKTNNHYYTIGTSLTRNATRFSMAFGRQRDGLFCVGGVCRFVPAAYGFTATLTTTFAN